MASRRRKRRRKIPPRNKRPARSAIEGAWAATRRHPPLQPDLRPDLLPDLVFDFPHPGFEPGDEVHVGLRESLDQDLGGLFHPALFQDQLGFLLGDLPGQKLGELKLLAGRAAGHAQDLMLEELQLALDVHPDAHHARDQPAFSVDVVIVRERRRVRLGERPVSERDVVGVGRGASLVGIRNRDPVRETDYTARDTPLSKYARTRSAVAKPSPMQSGMPTPRYPAPVRKRPGHRASRSSIAASLSRCPTRY